ncbi:MAG: HAMP domain-containing histidine kinase [Rhodospirillales bacterium]|nr:HAMP domain-containing histidine kinase [Rhodospirillales bacterium]
MLKDLGEVVRIKVFDPSGAIVWSDDASLIGTKATRTANITQAAAGGNTVVFYEEEETNQTLPETRDPLPPVVEFYVPIHIRGTASAKPEVGGVMALYRSSASLNATIERGIVLVWLVTAIGGALLFTALFALFRSVWLGRQEAESQLMRLSGEHQRIIHLEKLSATGTMVGEIAHQINNPLVGVVNLAQLAEREADVPVRVKALLADIRHAGEHCSEFVKRMLAFTKAARCQLQPVSLAPLVADTAALFRDSTPGHPSIELNLPEGNTDFEADPVLIRHALFNLLNNAFQASPITAIKVELAPEPHPHTHRHGWRLEVIDHGPGIPASERERIFTPFFTTKPGGMGLGLSVVEHIVVQHGGDITIHDTPGGGARFLLWFPRNVLPGGVK